MSKGENNVTHTKFSQSWFENPAPTCLLTSRNGKTKLLPNNKSFLYISMSHMHPTPPAPKENKIKPPGCSEKEKNLLKFLKPLFLALKSQLHCSQLLSTHRFVVLLCGLKIPQSTVFY